LYRIDPITLQVLNNAFISVSEEMGSVIVRTARSSIVREGKDFSTAILGPDGDLIAQASYIPAHLNTMSIACKEYLKRYPSKELRPGDVVGSNDPLCGPHHFPDLLVVMPIFWKDELVAFACNLAHHIDFGGRMGGVSGTSGGRLEPTEMYHEGLRLPPLKLYEEGRPNKAIFDIIKANVRVNEQVIGDIQSQMSALYIGKKRIEEILAERGKETVFAFMQEIMNYSEGRVRSNFDTIPDGEYEYLEYVDDDGVSPEPVEIKVKLSVKGSDIHVDFTGTAKQRKGNINMYLPGTICTTNVALRYLCDPDIPHNDGCFRPITINAPEGTIVNPTFPAGGLYHHPLHHRIVEAIFAALSRAVPDRIIAGSYGTSPVVLFGGFNPETGRRYVHSEGLPGGTGARPNKDGISATAANTSNCTIIPIEASERLFPILYTRFELVPDSGGPGKYRGGLTYRREFQTLAPETIVTVKSDRNKFPAYGLFGGKPGRVGEAIVNPGRDDMIRLPSKTMVVLKKGDIFSFMPAAGGGYGNPFERDPELVWNDVIEGKISIESARRDYGISTRSPRSKE